MTKISEGCKGLGISGWKKVRTRARLLIDRWHGPSPGANLPFRLSLRPLRFQPAWGEILRAVGCGILVLSLGFAASAQIDQTGYPAFSSQANSVNLGNLNETLTFPIFSKPGRGIPVNYALHHNSTFYTIIISGGPGHPGVPLQSFSADLPFECLGCLPVPPKLGWDSNGNGLGVSPFGVGSVGSSSSACGSSGSKFTNFTFMDPYGTSHPLPSSVVTGTDPSCGPAQASGYAVDQSGYFITANSSGSGTAQDLAGNTFNLNGYPVATLVTDRNGNTISADFQKNTTTDTMGVTTLSVSGTTDSSGNPTSYIYSFPAPGGKTASVVVNYKLYNIASNFGCPNIGEYGSNAVSVVDNIVLADGVSKYTFAYEPTPGATNGSVTGRLQSVTLPTGSEITYGYPGSNGGISCVDGTILNLTRTTSDGTTTYNRSVTTKTISPCDGSTCFQQQVSEVVTVTDPQGNQTVINFMPLTNPQIPGTSWIETQRQRYQGSSSSGALLQTTIKCYNGNKSNCASTSVTMPVTEVSTFLLLPNGKENEQDTFLDSTTGGSTEVDEYDFGNNAPGALLRKTVTTYASLGNNILNRPASVTVCNPGGTDAACNGAGTSGGTKIAQTTFNYDVGSPAATSGITQHVAVSGSRGNLTSVHRWLNTNNTTLDTTNTFDDTGNVLTTTDPGSHKSSFTYGGCNGTFPTQTNLPDTSSPSLAHHTTFATYDCNTGRLATSADQNNQVTKFFYDSLFRTTEVDYPDGGQTLTSYPDLNHVTVTGKIDSSRTTSSTTVRDGYGRVSRTAVANGESTPYDQQDSCYDSNGRLSFRSYPYQGNAPNGAAACPNTSLAGDTFAYDALGRTTSVTHSDGTSASTTYTSLAAQVTDEGNGASSVSRIMQMDGLGRLSSVCELYSGSALLGNGGTPASCGMDIAGTGFVTAYGYDTLGNLTTVTQGSLPNRTYAYDSLSRLTSETTPEAGTVSYTYNADSLLSTRVRPAPNQASSTTTTKTNYTYDALHRLVGRSYTGDPSNTPAAAFHYDESSLWGTSLANTVGRMTSESVGSPLMAEQIFSYDPAGRVSLNAQCTPNTCNASPFNPYSLAYQYDLLGDLTSAGNGVGITFTDSYNIAGRLTGMTSSLSDANHPATLLSNVSYSPTRITGTLGNGVVETANSSPRGLLTSYLGDAPGGQPGTGAVAITGALQTYTTGSVTINSSTGELCDTDPVVCQTGSVSITFNNAETDSVTYGSGDTTSTVAAKLAKAINNCGQPSCYATATSSGATVTFTSTATGAGANWPVSTSSNAPDATPSPSSAIWSTATVQTPNSKTGAPGCLGSTLRSGQSLLLGQCINSPNGRFVFVLQTAANLVLYDDTPDPNPWTPLWSNGTQGSAIDHCYMQSEGNFVCYQGTIRPIWYTDTGGGRPTGAYYMIVQDDGNVVIYTGFPQPSFTIGPAQQTTVHDNGSTSINVNGHADGYGWSGSGTTAGSIAQGLCNAINGDTGAFVTANTNGTAGQCPLGSATVRLVSKQSGQNYSLTASTTSVKNSFSVGCPGFADCTSASLSGAGNPAYSFSLGRAPDGQITSANDFVNGNWVFGYDPFNRLASSNKNSGQQKFTYVYDRYGNRWQENPTGSQGGPAPQYVFDNNNHFSGSGVTYDALGEVMTDGLGNSFTWDAEGRLIQVTQSGTIVATYSYDAEGRRVHGPNGEYVYDLAGHVITELGWNGTMNVVNNDEIYAGGRHLATYLNGTTYFFHSDWLGTKRVITALNGTNSQICTGLPFGDGVSCTGAYSSINNYIFTDDLHDPESNLEHTPFRKYSGTEGRWLTPDPAGTASADPANPQSWNRYAYVTNNPVNAIDRSGLQGFGSGDLGGFGLCDFIANAGCGFSSLGNIRLPGDDCYIDSFTCGYGIGFAQGEYQPPFRLPNLSDPIGALLGDLQGLLDGKLNPCANHPDSGMGFVSNCAMGFANGELPVLPGERRAPFIQNGGLCNVDAKGNKVDPYCLDSVKSVDASSLAPSCGQSDNYTLRSTAVVLGCADGASADKCSDSLRDFAYFYNGKRTPEGGYYSVKQATTGYSNGGVANAAVLCRSTFANYYPGP